MIEVNRHFIVKATTSVMSRFIYFFISLDRGIKNLTNKDNIFNLKMADDKIFLAKNGAYLSVIEGLRYNKMYLRGEMEDLYARYRISLISLLLLMFYDWYF